MTKSPIIYDPKEWSYNEDGERVLRIIKTLTRNQEKYGAPYCPCKIERINENICPCYEYSDSGICKCGLYKSTQQ